MNALEGYCIADAEEKNHDLYELSQSCRTSKIYVELPAENRVPKWTHRI